jgi:hypothetical protein
MKCQTFIFNNDDEKVSTIVNGMRNACHEYGRYYGLKKICEAKVGKITGGCN